jgi:hypothetical protein
MAAKSGKRKCAYLTLFCIPSNHVTKGRARGEGKREAN